MDESADSLDLDREEDHEHPDRERQGESRIDIGRRHDAETVRGMLAEKPDEPRHDVHGQEVHGVHEEHPDEHGERERRDELVRIAVEYALHLVADEVEAKLHECLPLRGHARARPPGYPPEEADADESDDP